MFNVNSIATYIQQPDLINIELTEAIWTELGWTRKSDALRKTQEELIEGTDFNLRKIAQVQNEGGRQVSREVQQVFLSYNGLKILAASTTTAKGKAYRRHLVETENKYIELMKEKSSGALSEKQVLQIAFKALGERIAQDDYCADKPGLRNIIEQACKPKDYKAFDAYLMDVEAIAFRVFNVELSPGELMSLGRLCAGTYRTWHNEEPKKVEDPGIKKNVCVYGTEMYATVENWLINKGYSVD